MPRNPTQDPRYDPFDNPAQLRKEMREIERPQREAYEAGIEEGRTQSSGSSRLGRAAAGYGVGRSVSRAIPSHPARSIAGLMVLAIGFSLFGNEVRAAKSAKSPGQATMDVTLTHFQIMAGGAGATMFLIVLAKAGDSGASFAQGLALIVFLSSVIVYGGPVWAAMADFMKPKNPSRSQQSNPQYWQPGAQVGGTHGTPAPGTASTGQAPTGGVGL